MRPKSVNFEMLTGLLIAILIVASAATVVGGGLVLASQRKRLPDPDDPALLGPGHVAGTLERTIDDVRVGDVLQYDTRDFLVEGVIRFDEDGHRWSCARATDGREERWVMIGLERRGGAGALMLTEDSATRVSGFPPETLVTDGVRFTQKKRGSATARATGDVGTIDAAARSPESVLRCRWWTYDSAGDEYLVVEQWGDDYRALRGRRTVDGEVELMPGS